MICPQCRTLVPDDAYICDACNAIVDTSFLGEGITNEAPPDEGATRIKAVDANATRIKAVEANAPRGKSAPQPKRSAFDDEEEKKSMLESAAPPAQTAEALEQFVQQFRRLPWSEQLTAGGALALLVSLGLPWVTTQKEGDIIGIVAGAWPIALLAILVAGAVFMRRHPKVQPHRDRLLGLNIGLSLLAVVGSAVFWRSARVDEVFKDGGQLIVKASEEATFGVYLGLAAGGVMLVGALLTWLERSSLPD